MYVYRRTETLRLTVLRYNLTILVECVDAGIAVFVRITAWNYTLFSHVGLSFKLDGFSTSNSWFRGRVIGLNARNKVLTCIMSDYERVITKSMCV